jgi:hypothetical protein
LAATRINCNCYSLAILFFEGGDETLKEGDWEIVYAVITSVLKSPEGN